MSIRRIWVLGETGDMRIKKVSFELIAWAASLGDRERTEVSVVLPGEVDNPEELCFYGADRVLHLNYPELNHFSPIPWSNAVSFLLNGTRPDVFLAAAMTTGKTLMPYVAAKHELGLTADCTSLEFDMKSGILLQTRPAAGGNIMATIKTIKGLPQMSTLRPNSIRILERDESRCVSVEEIAVSENLMVPKLEYLGFEPYNKDEKDIQEAVSIVAGGKGMKKKDNFQLLENLAVVLGAQIGASREAVDKGWVPYPEQIGLSGKTVTPDLYIAAGISGAIQHLAGMHTAGTIISINEDPDAQIFNISDYGLVGDLFRILPVLTDRLRSAVPEKE